MSVMPGFWLVLVIIILPPAISASRRAVEHLLRPPGSAQAGGAPSVIEVTLEHGIQAFLIIGAVAVLAWSWDVDRHCQIKQRWYAPSVGGAVVRCGVVLGTPAGPSPSQPRGDRKLTSTPLS
jgi:hypothetical protein